MDPRRTRLAAVAALLAAAPALAASPAHAAPQPPGVALHHGTLLVRGTAGDDTLAIRPRPFTYDVDLDGDGRAEARVPRFLVRSVLVRGGEGADELAFEGSAAAERYALEPRGDGARLTRDVGHVRIDLDGVERVATRALGGADVFTAGDLRGTVVNDVDLDLGSDGARDRVISRGSDESDFGDVLASGAGVFVLGMPAFLHVGNAEPDDELLIDGRGGDDRINASGPMRITVDGGAGDDDLAGGAGAETLAGRGGDDFADGNGGADRLLLGGGDDIARWDPGDGSDTVEGDAGHDVLLFLGSSADERIDVTAAGKRVRFTRDVGAIVMDLAGVEKTDTLAQGGADTIAVGDLTGTGLALVETNLSGLPGLPAGDGVTDRVLVTGTPRSDALALTGAAGTFELAGLPATVRATRSEAGDRLELLGGDGADTLDQTGLAPGTVGVTFTD